MEQHKNMFANLKGLFFTDCQLTLWQSNVRMLLHCDSDHAVSADHEWFVVFQECCGKGVNGCCVTVNQNGTVNHKTQNGDINVSF